MENYYLLSKTLKTMKCTFTTWIYGGETYTDGKKVWHFGILNSRQIRGAADKNWL